MSSRRVIAVIDVGSNSIRLLVARELSHLAFEVIDEERYGARLGEGQAGDALSDAGIERGVRAMRIVTQVARSHAPTTIIAAGTEALRRATNAETFMERVHAETGIVIRLLSAREEGYASFLGVVNSTLLRDGQVVDIGGGSLELMQVQDRRLVRDHSVPLGAIYSTERYFQGDPPSPGDVRSLRKAVRKQLPVERQATLYGVGGAVRALARIARARRSYPLRRLHGFEIGRRDFRRITRTLVESSPDDRRKIPGMNPSRVDILPAAAVVLDEIMERSGAERLVVSGQGLREGLAWQELRGEPAILPDVRGASIHGLARANGVNDMAAEPVVAAAAALFDAASRHHGLGADDRELLLAAARLSGLGMHVDYYNRDRHAEYLVHSGPLHGFTHREIVLLASMVRWADSGTPDLSPYRTLLRPDDPRRATVLAVLLGAAEAVARRTPSPVHRFAADLADGSLRLALSGGDSLDAELYALEQQQKRLESVLKVPVTICAG